jgi:hypothetical protein
MHSSLVINCHGPPISRLDEQLSILDPGGELYFNIQKYKGDLDLPVLKDGFQQTQNIEKGIVGYIIQRNF